MFPKIAAVLGAHTELGKLVVRELLRFPYVAKVHALAEVDPRDDITVRPRDAHKLVLHLDPLDSVEQIISRYIPECDIAFCVLGCGKKDMAAMGAYQFHKTNLDIPRRFIHEMFILGVERITLLSHAAASPKARGSEFLRVKAELESIVRELQVEAAEYAPGVTVFKLPLMLTNLKDASGMRGTSITTTDKVKQKAALKLELSPSRAVHVRDVAKAMVADMFDKLQMADAGSEVEPVFRRRDIRYAEMDGQEVVNLAHERRTMQRENISRVKQQLAFDQRISGYARKHGGLGSATASTARHGSAQSGLSREHSGTHSGLWEESVKDSNESFMSGSAPDEEYSDESQTAPGEDVAPHDKSLSPSHVESPGPPSPVPSSEPRRFEEEGSTDAGSGRFHSPGRRRRSTPPAGSVEALGHQLGRRLTVIRNNEYLADVDPMIMPSSRKHHRAHHSDQPFSRQSVAIPSQSPRRYKAQDSIGSGLNGELRDTNQPVHSRTTSLQSPSSGSLGHETPQDSPIRSPGVRDRRFDSPQQIHATGSSGVPPQLYDHSPSQSRTYERSSAERYPDFYGSGRISRRESDYRGGTRSEKTGTRPSSLITRVTEFAERVIAATDRPSMKRRDRFARTQPFRGRDGPQRDRGDDPLLRGNGDMRPIGETAI